MKYDFSTAWPKDRVHPFLLEEGVKDPSVLPHSVAEMRFRLMPEISEAMHRAVDVGLFGYQPPDSQYAESVISWMKRRHNWSVHKEWMTQTAGVVVAIGLAIRSFTEPGDGVIIQPPVYGPFRSSVENNHRTLIENPLLCDENGRYTMDLDDLRKKAPSAKMLILCSPHNPCGRVWTGDELAELCAICREHDLFVVSDEIHFDLVWNKHTVLTEADPEIASRCIICTAPSKTFNLAGCGLSNIIIPNEDIRRRFTENASRECGHYLNAFGYAAVQAAYQYGDDWVDQCLGVIEKNYRITKQKLHSFCPDAVISPLEGTYLTWLDFSCLKVDDSLLNHIFKKNLVFVNDGEFFGTGGFNHVRFNIAAPQKNVEGALARMEKAVAELRKLS